MSHSVYYKERVGRLSQWSAVILDRGLFSGNVRGQCVIRVHQNELGEVRRVRRGQLLSPPALCCSQSLQVEALTRLRFQRWSWVYLDEGLGLAAVVYLDVDLGVRVALVSKALEVAAVAQQVDGQAESQHA